MIRFMISRSCGGFYAVRGLFRCCVDRIDKMQRGFVVFYGVFR